KRVVLHGPRTERQEGANRNVHSQRRVTIEDWPDSLADSEFPMPSRTAPELVDKRNRTQSDRDPPDNWPRLPGDLISHISESSDGIDLHKALKNRYQDDSFFREILKNPHHYKNFEVEGGLVFLKDKQGMLLCVPDVQIGSRSARELVIRHAHSLLAHLGSHKTLGLMRDHVWWKS
ncbi:hypothetical protein OBBRIDRAFT_694506, partial [Obba rivulosa]